MYLWAKALHLIFGISWVAGVFYLPRFLVYGAQESSAEVRAKLLLMGQRLNRFTNVLMVLALVFGIAMLVINSALFQQSWIHSKLMLVFVLIGYQHVTAAMLRRLENPATMRSERFYRIYGEVPIFILVAIVLLAVFRP